MSYKAQQQVVSSHPPGGFRTCNRRSCEVLGCSCFLACNCLCNFLQLLYYQYSLCIPYKSRMLINWLKEECNAAVPFSVDLSRLSVEELSSLCCPWKTAPHEVKEMPKWGAAFSPQYLRQTCWLHPHHWDSSFFSSIQAEIFKGQCAL